MVAVALCEAPVRYGGHPAEVVNAEAEILDPRPTILNPPRPTAPGPPPLSEATLVRLWAGQRFPASALVTTQGALLRVLHPGRAGRGAGPDFRDAIIARPSGGLLRGDVELHVRASDFQAHGHHRDRRYDRVVLHVVFEDDGADDTRLACDRRALLVALAPWVRRRASELAGWLSSPALWREPCHDAVARLGPEALIETLEELGERRFREREAFLTAAVASLGCGEALYRALLEGLGYGGERAVFAAVADLLPWRELEARLAGESDGKLLAEALLLGSAGLLASQLGAAPKHHHELRLEERWREAALPSGFVAAVGGHRPANHPARRLAGLARLLTQHAHALQHAAPAALLDAPPARVIADWSAPAEGYWREYDAPGTPARRTPGALIGRGRAIELLANAVLPWAAARAEASGEAATAAQARGRFAHLPRPGRYGALAFLEANLRDGGRPLALDARRQHGLLALYKTECTQGGCGRCPLS